MSKVLVLNATGKVGTNVVIALKEAGHDVYGTTRGGSGIEKLQKLGVNSVKADYTKPADLNEAFRTSGAKIAFIITDFFLAAKSKQNLEIEQGKAQVDACKAAGCEYVIYSSAGDADKMNEKVKHIKGKVVVEQYLFASGLKSTVLRPVAFFENLDDPVNWNPLKKGSIKFLTEVPVKLCACYDIGRAAARLIADPDAFNGKIIDVASWQGSGADMAAALQKVSGHPTKFSLAMPKFFRGLFLNDLHHMCLYFEKQGGFTASIEDFRRLVPDALTAEDWFRRLGHYSNGEKFGGN